jgi:hypothetical protein
MTSAGRLARYAFFSGTRYSSCQLPTRADGARRWTKQTLFQICPITTRIRTEEGETLKPRESALSVLQN